MARTKATTEEQIANLNRRATETRNSMLRKRIECAMRNHPKCLEGLWDKLVSMCFSESSILEKENVPKSFQANAIEERKKRKLEEDSASLAPAEDQDDEVPDMPRDNIPKK